MNMPIQKKEASERIAIENSVKNLRINRSCFAEYSKTGYEQIINRFLYTFVDHKYLQKEEQKQLNEVHTVKFSWVGLRADLKEISTASERELDFESMVDLLPEKFASGTEKIFFITSEGWVYYGTLDETMKVLKNLSLDEIYLVTADFQKLAVYSSDSELLQILSRQ